ncbi:low temperature requirement protein A [Streptomyces rhizosphaerihabitans]|uniref:low temperature requirement protein A n=1 Tax=Streptomyces rhizosphaerihabitans TaxID=1266770 RepID=UPI0021C02197|nr:low temperature requirement protein A [Streptomyces rhizosphaerihabitans]MCT9007516.1 low temperature requirement protein A [Streptomyces rhizosphaerihabitans]
MSSPPCRLHHPVASTTDPVRSVRLGVNGAYAVLADPVTLTVAGELVIAHPLGHGSATVAPLFFGGPALCLAATDWFFHAAVHGAWTERLLACAACILAGIAAIWLSRLAILILTVTATVTARAHRRLSPALQAATGT